MVEMALKIWLLFVCTSILTASVIPAAHKKDPLSDEEHYNKANEHNTEYDHEAFLGQDAAKEFEQLTPEQSKERLAKLLPVIDKDADGFVTEDELKSHIKFMQKRYVLNDVERTWKAHPTADGKLAWKEYRDAVFGPEDPANPPEPIYEKMMLRDQKRWNVADVNKDGELDKEEYTCFMHPEDCAHMKDIVVEETIADIDKDGDGLISLDEYIGDMYRPDGSDRNAEEPDWVKSERDMFKRYRDTDGDGKLNKNEMKEWIMPSNFDHAEAEAKHLLHMADDDKDGKLSKSEILEHYDVFVGSQATDYGEQLQKHDPTEL